MSTQLFLRLAASDLGGAGQQALSVTRGAASHTAVTNTTASGTNIQVTATAAGQALTWFSAPLAGITISGSVTVNIRGLESSTSANSKAGITIEHTDSLGNVLSTIVANTAVPTTSSEYTTSDTAKNASFTPTSTALNYGDRIKVTLFVKNQGTMGGGFTVTNSYDGPTAAAAGDTYVTFTETLFPAYSGGPQGWSSPPASAPSTCAPAWRWRRSSPAGRRPPPGHHHHEPSRGDHRAALLGDADRQRRSFPVHVEHQLRIAAGGAVA